ncbi:LysR family transcriptional regulator [Glycomyces sp. NPDC047010]|uniref:LysR family transcriptional regulator n=1 Tax=Glycomyces sp. NPDC047010 TaxID=3155023 RepID=UPI0034116CF3
MERPPDLEGLRALALVAETGSLNAAAARLGVTQQAVSLRLRALETRLGVPLLVRSPRGSTLTSAGQLVSAWAGPLLAAAEEFTESVGSLREGRERTLRIAASLTIAEHLLPEWIARWRGAGAGPAVQLLAANSDNVIDTVRRGDAALGFIETPSVPADLKSLTIGRDELVVVAPPTHPWSRRKAVTVEELATTALVLREPGSGTRAAFEAALADAGAPLAAPPNAELSTTLGLRSTIAAGAAPGVLSSLAVQEDLRTRRLRRVRIRDLEIIRPLTAIWPAPRPAPAADDLLRSITTPTRRP